MLEIPQKIQNIVVIVIACIIEIALLAFYDSEKNKFELILFPCEADCSGFALQMVEAIFMLIGFLILIPLYFLKVIWKKWILLGNICFMGLGLFLGLIGMGITSYLYQSDKSPYKLYNYVVAFWFIEVGLFVLALMYEYVLFRESEMSTKVQNLNNTTVNSIPSQQMATNPK